MSWKQVFESIWGGPKSVFESFEINAFCFDFMHFSYIFTNLGFSSRFNFGPRDFKTKVGRNDGYWLSGWAEMNTWGSMYVVFRPTKLGRNHKQFYACFGSKITYLWAFLHHFVDLEVLFNFNSVFRPNKCLNRKNFGKLKVLKWL